MNSAACLFLLICLLTGAQCRPNGAPNSACDGVGPDPTAHGADPQSTIRPPYVLTGLPTSGNYTPGMSYTVTLGSSSNEVFQGFLVVARNTATLQRVGSFTSGGADSITTCSDMRGITHTNANNKTSVSFTWTAPPEGAGRIEFRFSVAQSQLTYWSNQFSILLQGPEPEPDPSTSTPTATHGGDATSTSSPSSTTTPESGDSNSEPSIVAGICSLAAILTAAIAFVMVAVFA